MVRLGVVSAEVGVAGDGSLITTESRDGGLNRRRRVVGIFTMLTTCPAKDGKRKRNAMERASRLVEGVRQENVRRERQIGARSNNAPSWDVGGVCVVVEEEEGGRGRMIQECWSECE
jgi:hypothetical protein